MNELLLPSEDLVFNQEVIKRGGFIRAKSYSWDEWRNGLVTQVGRDVIKALFLTGVSTGSAYYSIKASELNGGLWSVRYSNDLEAVTFDGAADTSSVTGE